MSPMAYSRYHEPGNYGHAPEHDASRSNISIAPCVPGLRGAPIFSRSGVPSEPGFPFDNKNGRTGIWVETDSWCLARGVETAKHERCSWCWCRKRSSKCLDPCFFAPFAEGTTTREALTHHDRRCRVCIKIRNEAKQDHSSLPFTRG